MLDSIVKSMFTFVRAIKLSSKVPASFCIPPSYASAPALAPQPHQHLVASVFWSLAALIVG